MQFTKQQLSYQQHAVRVRSVAHGVMRRHNRHDTVTLDGGRMEMLSDDADHSLRIPTGPANVDVVIAANWFLDPDRFCRNIEAAVESAFRAASAPAASEKCFKLIWTSQNEMVTKEYGEYASISDASADLPSAEAWLHAEYPASVDFHYPHDIRAGYWRVVLIEPTRPMRQRIASRNFVTGCLTKHVTRSPPVMLQTTRSAFGHRRRRSVAGPPAVAIF